MIPDDRYGILMSTPLCLSVKNVDKCQGPALCILEVGVGRKAYGQEGSEIARTTLKAVRLEVEQVPVTKYIHACHVIGALGRT